MNHVIICIAPSHRNIRLSEALNALIWSAVEPIGYSIESYGVAFSNSPRVRSVQVETRRFQIGPVPSPGQWRQFRSGSSLQRGDHGMERGLRFSLAIEEQRMIDTAPRKTVQPALAIVQVPEGNAADHV